MSSTRPILSDDLIQELTAWTLRQFAEGIQRDKLDVRKIVCRLLREGQQTKQLQMPKGTKRRPAQMPKGTKRAPSLSPRRNTSGIVGVCPLIEQGVQLGWVAYYQKDDVQQRRKFRFSEFGDETLANAQSWREKCLQQSIRATKGAPADARRRQGIRGKRAVKSGAKRRKPWHGGSAVEARIRRWERSLTTQRDEYPAAPGVVPTNDRIRSARRRPGTRR